MSLNYTLQLEAIQKKIFSVDPKVDDTIFIEHKSLKPSTKMKVLSFIYCKTQQLKKIAQYPLFIFKKNIPIYSKKTQFMMKLNII